MSSQRLPKPGGDVGDWGNVLNGFLSVAHNADGSLKASAVTGAGGELAASKGQASGYASLNSIKLVPTAELGTGTANSGSFLRGDGTWAAPAAGSGNLAGDSDVTVTSPANNQVLTYNSGSGKWQNSNALVPSVFGRTGAVTAQTGDYNASQVGALPSTDDLSAIATANVTSGNVSLNSHKVTGLANGSASSDAAAFGQIPTSASSIGGLLASNNLSDVGSAATARSNLGAAQGLTPTGVKTSGYTAFSGDFVPIDTTSGSVAVTLPNAPADGTRIGVKMIIQGGTNTITINASGSDVFNKASGAVTETITLLNQGMLLQYVASSRIWYIQADDLTLSSLDARYSAAGAFVTRAGGTNGVATAPLPFLNAEDFGAKFDGVTDDSANLNTAQASAGSVVILPPATTAIAAGFRFDQSREHIRGAGMYATIVKAITGLAGVLSQLASGFVSSVTLEDMTFDGGGVATNAIHAYGWGIGRLTIRRCRFVNFPGGIIDAGYAAEFVIEDCEVEGAGLATASFFTATNKEFDSLILRRNKIRWVANGIIIGSNGAHATYVEIDDNDFEMGWMHTKALFSGSGGTVTYTSTSVTDTTAAFSGLGAFQPVRAMPILQTGTFTTENGTHVADTSAAFTTNGVMRNHIVRSGTSFGVVNQVESATTLHVREWLSQTTYLPVAPPAIGDSYTIYGLLFLNRTSSNGTSITGIHGASGGGGGWYDLTGVESTPSAGTLYEVLPLGNYPIFLTNVTDKVQITNNRIRGGWSDQIEHFGTRAIITGNLVEDGNNFGIFTGSSTTTPTLDKSIISNNIIKHNALGLGVTGASDVEIGPNQYEDNGWGVPVGNPPRQIQINDSVRVTLTGGNATNTAECAINTVGLYLAGATLADCKVLGFRGNGHALGDVLVETTAPAGVCELINVSGTISYTGTTNGQRLQVKGTGAPSLVASPGSQFLRTDGSNGTTLYIKETGNGSSGWTAFTTTSSLAYGQRTLYSAITAGISATITGSVGNALNNMASFTGTVPSITLPSDGHTYRVTFQAPDMSASVQNTIAVGVGTSGSSLLSYIRSSLAGGLDSPCHIDVDVVASGQILSVYAYSSGATGTVGIDCAANAPAFLSAILVAA